MIMDRMRKVVLDKVSTGPPLLQAFFKFAYDYKLRQIRNGYDTPVLNRSGKKYFRKKIIDMSEF